MKLFQHLWILVLLTFSPKLLLGNVESKVDSMIRVANSQISKDQRLEQYLLIEKKFNKDIGPSIIDDSLKTIFYEQTANHYFLIGNGPKCIYYSFLALEIAEKLSNEQVVFSAYFMISDMYAIIGDYKKSKTFFNKTIRIIQKDNRISENNLAGTYGNLALDYFLPQKMYDSSLIYLHKGWGNFKKHNTNLEGIGNQFLFYSSLGKVHALLGNADSANFYYQYLEDYFSDNPNQFIREKAFYLASAGQSYLELGNIEKAEKLLREGYQIVDSLQFMEPQSDINEQLYKLYKRKKKDGLALFYHEKFHQSYKQLFNNDQQNKTVASLLNYQAEKKEAEEKAKKVIAQLKIEEERKHQLFIRNTLITGSLILSGLLLIIFQRLRVTRKQKVIIETQKNEVDKAYHQLDEKNTEILDSITYAKRIQSAILPPTKLFKTYLKNSFILYQPKDVVAGDFYWMEHKHDKILFAAADCTGHGVPGAMVSVVCNNALNRSVREFGLSDPGEILDSTRAIVLKEFEKSEEKVYDGMDIALCSFEGNTLKYAGAYNPLWIIRKEASEVEEIKADKQPIGKFELSKPFTTHTVELKPGDSIYIFSDGFADQFGGEMGKKYKSGKLKKFLLSIQQHRMDEQHDLIRQEFENWRGDLEQLDDVCFIGIRV